MAKTAKPKRNNAAGTINPRSRAAKRDTSPSLNTDKSLKEVDRADIGPILHSRQNAAGAINKKKKTAPLKRGQRARQERGLARAEAVMDQLEKKVEGAQNRVKKRRDRRAQWEEVNAVSVEERRKAPKLTAFDGLLESIEGQGEAGEGDDDGEGAAAAVHGGRDVDLEMETVDETSLPRGAAGVKMLVVERPASTSLPPEEEDEIT
ncbi:hypothetical protein DV738_g5185, partial [Chaetothyriales sp. CBS 135597]